MKRLREAPTSSGQPNARNSESRASAVMLCSGVLPKPMPGSSTIRLARDPGLVGDLERAREEGGDVLHDVDGRIDCLAIVHRDQRHRVVGDHARHVARRAAGPRRR